MVISVLSIVVLVLITMLVLLFKFSLHIYKSNLALIKTCEDLGKYYDTFVKLYNKYRAAESSADKTESAKNILDATQDVNNNYYRELESYKQRYNE
jgi:hypothetical protein